MSLHLFTQRPVVVVDVFAEFQLPPRLVGLLMHTVVVCFLTQVSLTHVGQGVALAPRLVTVDADHGGALGARPVHVEHCCRADVTHFTNLGLKSLPDDLVRIPGTLLLVQLNLLKEGKIQNKYELAYLSKKKLQLCGQLRDCMMPEERLFT